MDVLFRDQKGGDVPSLSFRHMPPRFALKVVLLIAMVGCLEGVQGPVHAGHVYTQMLSAQTREVCSTLLRIEGA
eukprot:4571811-Pyramimonas_sp.AAC.1